MVFTTKLNLRYIFGNKWGFNRIIDIVSLLNNLHVNVVVY